MVIGRFSNEKEEMNKTEHAVQSYAAAKTKKIAMPINNADAKQC